MGIYSNKYKRSLIKQKKLSIFRELFLYLENHALDAWFSKAYSGEDDKELQIG